MFKHSEKIEKQNSIPFKIDSYYKNYNPYLLKNMSELLKRIISSINNREKIILYSYPDVDCITSVSMLLLVMRYLNADVEHFITSNIDCNKCLNYDDVLGHLKFLNPDLILCIGCGNNSSIEVELCNRMGIDVIIIGNQYFDDTVLNDISINPSQKGCEYPFKELSCSGVVFKLIQTLSNCYKIKYFYRYVDLAMLGTLSCGVKLTGENRLILDAGMKYLKHTNNYGIRALMKIHNIIDINIDNLFKLIDTIKPTMNAVGLIDNARIIIELFTTSNYFRAEQIAKYLYTEAHKIKNENIFVRGS
ncbi:single-stranded-DNA-specific exonuclease RecJ [Clostridium tepidiprofundi DSM 19306]|uniref:Single-stranded-DNA-specific exonuclease RecJ n=1 Tax=Clostridium tepidiprofundi DSM 19306 TaxID=1121338 RepID=A0A151B7U8_9CLOT|nr:DHH family phosphoesterase [Clostridium tepidiprofundi]KYH36021.1 single-stranded-DNA-specific exonuclease RecJ [Clostridium tepidiprofundi DSM 19306]